MTSTPILDGTDAAACERKTARTGERATPRIEKVGQVWHIRSYEAVRQVLRQGSATRQAGFNSEAVRKARPKARPPVIFQDGPEHRTQRSAIARFFAPATVSKRYRRLMEERADAITQEFVRVGRLDLPHATMLYSVEVAAQVVGLTNSDPDEMARRLEAFFDMSPVAPGADAGRFGRLLAVARSLRTMPAMMRFNKADVQPAVAARRTQPQDDVISHLIAQGYSEEEILIECITYGAAGMITTREFISMATWHLLERPELRDRYLVAPEPERHAILDEILRLEPVVGHLFRRTTAPLTLTDGEATYEIAAGELLDLYLRAANADPSAVGDAPLALCPGRELAAGVRPEAMGFGDGNHKCPGNFIATQETDVFLQRLLRLPIRPASTPRIEWDELISGYAVRSLILELTSPDVPE